MMVNMLSPFHRLAAPRPRRAALFLIALAGMPLSPAWAYIAPTPQMDSASDIRRMPYQATGSCAEAAAGGGGGCHDSSPGNFTAATFAIRLPDGVNALAFDGATALSVGIDSVDTRGVSGAWLGFHLRASAGHFVGAPAEAVRYFAVGGSTVAATHSATASGRLRYAVHWTPPAHVADQATVTFHYCAQVVNGDGERIGDGPSVCGVDERTVNQKPQVGELSVPTAHNASDSVAFRLAVTAGLAPASSGTFSVISLPTKGRLAAAGIDIATTGVITTSSLSYRPNANAAGRDRLVWAVSDGVDTVTATVTFNIAAAPVSPSGGDSRGGGCAASASSASFPGCWWLLAAVAWRRRRRAARSASPWPGRRAAGRLASGPMAAVAGQAHAGGVRRRLSSRLRSGWPAARLRRRARCSLVRRARGSCRAGCRRAFPVYNQNVLEKCVDMPESSIDLY